MFSPGLSVSDKILRLGGKGISQAEDCVHYKDWMDGIFSVKYSLVYCLEVGEFQEDTCMNTVVI